MIFGQILRVAGVAIDCRHTAFGEVNFRPVALVVQKAVTSRIVVHTERALRVQLAFLLTPKIDFQRDRG